MRVLLAVACDYAMIDRSDKLSVIGIFTTIGSQSVPCSHPHMALVVSLEVEPEDMGRTVLFEIEPTDQDGRRIADPIRQEINVPNEGVLRRRFDMIFNLVGFTFPAYGPYSFTVFLDAEPVATIPVTMGYSGP